MIAGELLDSSQPVLPSWLPARNPYQDDFTDESWSQGELAPHVLVLAPIQEKDFHNGKDPRSRGGLHVPGASTQQHPGRSLLFRIVAMGDGVADHFRYQVGDVVVAKSQALDACSPKCRYFMALPDDIYCRWKPEALA